MCAGQKIVMDDVYRVGLVIIDLCPYLSKLGSVHKTQVTENNEDTYLQAPISDTLNEKYLFWTILYAPASGRPIVQICTQNTK